MEFDTVSIYFNLCKSKWLILSFIILLNILIRIPLVSHELGSDSFFNHAWTISLISEGTAVWIIHPLSYFGLIPGSDNSGGQFLMAMFSILSNIDIETAILIFSFFTGIIAVFVSYTIAKEFSDNPCFWWLCAFVFSTSALLLKFSIWTFSTRIFYLLLVPLFIWSLFRINKTKKGFIYFILLLIFAFSIAATHSMFGILIPIIIAYIVSFIVYSFVSHINLSHKLVQFSKFGLVLIFISAFFANFFGPIAVYESWPLRYTPFDSSNLIYGLLFTISARLGPILILSTIGLLIYIYKNNKTLQEWFLLIILLMITPFLIRGMYFYQSLLPFYALLSTCSIIFIVNKLKTTQKLPFFSLILIILILFSSFTLFIRYSSPGNYASNEDVVIADYISNNIQGGTDYVGLSRQIRAYTQYSYNDFFDDDFHSEYLLENKIKDLNIDNIISYVRGNGYTVTGLEPTKREINYKIFSYGNDNTDKVKIYSNDQYSIGAI